MTSPPHWLQFFIDLLKAFLQKPPLAVLFAFAVTGWIALFPPPGPLRSVLGALPSKSLPLIGLGALFFSLWAAFVIGGRIWNLITAAWKWSMDRWRVKKRLANLALDERSLLASFAIQHRTPTCDADFVVEHWQGAAYRLRDDGILRKRSGEFAIIPWVWDYLQKHRELIDQPPKATKDDD